MSLWILNEVQHDANGIVDRLNDKELGLGDEFTTEFERAIAAIRQSPRLMSPTEDGPRGYESREFLIRRFSQRVIFVVLEDQVAIVAIVHASRTPGSWKRRLRSLEERIERIP